MLTTGELLSPIPVRGLIAHELWAKLAARSGLEEPRQVPCALAHAVGQGIRYSSVEVRVNQLRPEQQHAGNSANRQEIRSAWLPDCRVPACAVWLCPWTAQLQAPQYLPLPNSEKCRKQACPGQSARTAGNPAQYYTSDKYQGQVK